GGIAGIDLGEKEKATAETMAILKSRAFLEHFIADRNLLPTLFQHRWDGARSRWKNTDSKPPPTLQDGYELFSKKILLVTQDQQKDDGSHPTGICLPRARSRSGAGAKAFRVADTLAIRYFGLLRRRAARHAIHRGNPHTPWLARHGGRSQP